jgi:hypothetical protein
MSLFNKSLKLDEWQKQIVLGSVLGSGDILPKNKSYYFRCRSHDVKWLEWKNDQLLEFASKTAFCLVKKIYYWRSIVHKEFSCLRDNLYIDNKRSPTMRVLNQLRDIAIGVWFYDKGKVEGTEASIRLSCGGEKIVQKYFSEVGMPCVLEGNVLKFTRQGTKKLLFVAIDKLPEFATDKILKNYEDR